MIVSSVAGLRAGMALRTSYSSLAMLTTALTGTRVGREDTMQLVGNQAVVLVVVRMANGVSRMR